MSPVSVYNSIVLFFSDSFGKELSFNSDIRSEIDELALIESVLYLEDLLETDIEDSEIESIVTLGDLLKVACDESLSEDDLDIIDVIS